MKKQVSLLLLILIFASSCFQAGIFTTNASTEFTDPTIFVESKTSAPGAQVKVNVNVKNNPGIAGAILRVSYDTKLTLIGAENGANFTGLNFTKPVKFKNPSSFIWDSESGQINDDGTILTLTFKVADDAKTEDLNIGISYLQGDIYNENLDNLNFNTVDGCITVKSYSLGDVNGNYEVDIKDATCIQMHIADLKILSNEFLLLADTDNDGAVTILDATEIQCYLAGLITSLGKETEASSSNPQTTTPTNNSYTVVFKDYDGTVIKTQTVNYGTAATAPDAPQRDGYIFLNWDQTFDNVTSDLVVTATYKQISVDSEYIVTFQNYDGSVLSSQNVLNGGTASLPANPTKNGETFLGWSGNYANISKNETVKAVYSDEKNVFIIESTSGSVNDTVTVLVSVDGTVKTCGFDFTILYYSGLELVAIDSDLDLDIVANTNAIENGIILNFSSASDKNKQRDIVELTFAIKDTDKEYLPITMDVKSAKEISGSNIVDTDYTVVNGLVKIQ